jgi:ribosome-binding protein aMBF1 (putative translation factor)
MATRNPSVHIETVARLERRLAEARERAAEALREARERQGLSLRQVSPYVRLSAAGLSLLETGQTWETSTARRVLEFYQGAARTAA